MEETWIDLEGITLNRGGEKLLDEVDFRLLPAQIVSLIGPNGAGKTTLLRVILGLLIADQGRRTVAPKLRLAYVPQYFHIPPDLPIHLARFLDRRLDNETLTLLRELNIAHLLHRPLQALSGGEMRRLLLARALLQDADVLALDEPAAGINRADLEDIYQIMLEKRRNSGIILISHDLDLVFKISDQIYCLQQKVLCSGSPDTLRQDTVFQNLLNTEHYV